jgi:hypothetical protein
MKTIVEDKEEAAMLQRSFFEDTDSVVGGSLNVFVLEGTIYNRRVLGRQKNAFGNVAAVNTIHKS